MSKTRKNFIFLFIILNSSILLVSLLYNLLFEQKLLEVFRSGCVFLNTFGLYCPGCGGSRSLHFLLNFDLIKSFIYYPAIPYTAALILEADVRILISIIKEKNNLIRMKKAEFILIPVIIMLNFFVRNILLFFGVVYINKIG